MQIKASDMQINMLQYDIMGNLTPHTVQLTRKRLKIWPASTATRAT